MRKLIFAIAVVIAVIVVGIRWYQAQPKDLKVANIEGFSYKGKIDVIGSGYYAENVQALLYRNKKVYWVKYRGADNRVKNIILPRYPRDTTTYNTLKFSGDSCFLMRR